MDKFPLMWKGKSMGELTVEQAGLYTWFDCRCRLPGEGLWCAWAVGEGGELRLGVLEPNGDRAVIRRRFSGRMAEPLGRLIRGELRPAAERTNTWSPVQTPETLFRTPWLRRELKGVTGTLTRTENGRTLLALPYDRTRPFPLTRLFCFARLRGIRGGEYLVFCLDGNETPRFHE